MADNVDKSTNPPGKPNKNAPSIISQQELDDLVKGEIDKLLASDPTPGTDSDSGRVSQDELDRLLAGAKQVANAGSAHRQQQAPLPPIISGIEVPPTEPPRNQEVQGSVPADDIDRLLVGEDSEKLLVNSDLDAPVTAESVATDTSMDQAITTRIDEQLSESSALDALLSEDSPAAVPAADIVDLQVVPDAADIASMKGAQEKVSLENLAAAAPAGATDDVLISQDLINSLLEDAANVNPQPVARVAEPADGGGSQGSSVESTPNAPSQAAAVDKPLSEPHDDMAVRLADSDLEDLEPTVKPKADDKSVPSPHAVAGRRLLRQSTSGLRRLLGLVPRFGVKEYVSLGVGLAIAGVTFGILYRNQARVPAQPIKPEVAVNVKEMVSNARKLNDEGKFTEARAALDAAKKANPAAPPQPEVLFQQVRADYSALPGKPTVAAADNVCAEIDRFIAAAPDSPEVPGALRWKADLFERTGSPAAALDVYSQILSQYGRSPDLDQTLFHMARIQNDSGRADQAADSLTRLVEQYPGSSIVRDAKLLMGDVQVTLGNRAEARKNYTQVAVAQPSDALSSTAYARLGQMAVEDGKYDDAIKLLESRLQNMTKSAGNDPLYLSLAQAYHGKGDRKTAETTLKEMIDFYPDSELIPRAYVELVHVMDEQGKRPEALTMATCAAQRFPGHPELVQAEAQLHAASGDDRAAADTLVGGLDAGSASPSYLLATGQALFKLNELKRAREIFEKLANDFPHAPETFDGQIQLAGILYKQGQARESLDRLNTMLQTYQEKPQRFPVVRALASEYATLGIHNRAAERYEQVAQLTNEPGVLAECTRELVAAGESGSALAVAKRVDVSQLPKPDAYAFLVAHGKGLQQSDPVAAVAKLEQAYNGFADQRTDEGNAALLDAYLAADKDAAARVLVTDMDAIAKKNTGKRPMLQRVAIKWGQYLFDKGDFRAAAEAYGMAVDPAAEGDQQSDWANFQRANSLLLANDPKGSLAVFDKVASTDSPWTVDAKLKADYVRLTQRLHLPSALTAPGKSTASPVPGTDNTPTDASPPAAASSPTPGAPGPTAPAAPTARPTPPAPKTTPAKESGK